MITRKIISIDEEKCNGCGDCVTSCAEGALAIVDGKAKVVKEQFCDGFGDCIGTCPTDALKIEERAAEEFDLDATRKHVAENRGEAGVERLNQTAAEHEKEQSPPPSGCPGSRMRTDLNENTEAPVAANTGLPPKINNPELQQWPVQIHLVSPGAPFFKNKELAVLSTCAPIASADVHWRFIRGRSVVVGCPKLDRTEPYAQKLGEILKDGSIPKVVTVMMEVPCCGGLGRIVDEAVQLSGRDNLEHEKITVKLNGEIARE